MRRLAALLVLASSSIALGDVEGISLENGFTARTLGMGGAFEAMPSSPDVVEKNPAVLPLLKAYQVDLDGAWDVTNKVAYGGAYVRDSATTSVAAGVGYHLLSTGHGGTREVSNLATLGVGVPLGESFAVGVNGHYLLRTNGPNHANAITMDAGAALKLMEGLFLSAAAHNLIDVHHPELSRYYSAALGLMMGAFSADLDVRSSFVGGFKPSFNMGAEYLLGSLVLVRAGYEIDTLQSQQFFSVGLGLTSEGSSVDLAYRHEVQGGDSDLLVLSLKTQL
jgi:hypothetical protein